MAKSRRNVGKEILAGLKELRSGDRGRVTVMPNVSQIRESTGHSQARFAQLLGVSPRTLQDWEQGRRGTNAVAGRSTRSEGAARYRLKGENEGERAASSPASLPS
jgi:putative transcriptional regulator